MKVLLTGSAGFVGAAIETKLRDAGHEVLGVDALIPQAHGSSVWTSGPIHRLDVREAGEWADLLAGVDVVCHQAAVVGAGLNVADLPLYASHNDLGTAALLAAMTSAGVNRLVLASSMVVYGEGRYTCAAHGDQAPSARSVAALTSGDFEHACPICASPLEWALVEEDARLDPRSSYAASKVAQELYAATWARQASAAVVALRYHNVYGPGMPRDTPYSGVAAIFRSAIEHGRPPRVFEDGRQMRDFVHVDDVANANLQAIERVRSDEEGGLNAYNVCSGRPVSIADVARHVTAGTGGAVETVVTGEFRSVDVRHVVASPAKAAAELGFRAQVMPEQGLSGFARDPLR